MRAVLLVVTVALAAAADRAEQARQFLSQCRDGKFDSAAAMFNERVAQALPAPKLKAVWGSMQARFGPLKAMGEPRAQEGGGFTLVQMRCEFTRATLMASVSFDGAGKIASFTLTPAPDANQVKQEPPYADPARYEEEPVTVGAEGWPLAGLVTRPKGAAASAAPIVVLVHGSGPHDRDESVGPNAPFRDLAHGLATQGIAVLRYEKRTHAHGAKLQSMPPDYVTVDTEVIDDALTALARARTLKGVDPKRVYLLGHSLGGAAAPEVAKRDGKLAGLILFAASDRQPDVMLLDQLQYLSENDPAQAAARGMVPGLRASFERVRSGQAKPGEIIFHAPPAYWKSLMALHPAQTAGELKDLPILVVRGGRDYQVTDVDFQAFRTALQGRSNVTFHVYPELNHLFQTGTGKSLPSEYDRHGFVDQRAIHDISTWINSSTNTKK